MNLPAGVHVFNLPRGEAVELRHTPFGDVGTVFSDGCVEAVWVSKAAEAIDPDWFSQPTVDLIVVLQGVLKVEFRDSTAELLLHSGDCLVLPPDTPCRAYRWPRDAVIPTLFLAVYPKGQD